MRRLPWGARGRIRMVPEPFNIEVYSFKASYIITSLFMQYRPHGTRFCAHSMPSLLLYLIDFEQL